MTISRKNPKWSNKMKLIHQLKGKLPYWKIKNKINKLEK